MVTPRRTKTKKSSNRTRAQQAGKSDMVLPGGVLLSERRRKGDSTPAVPGSKTKNTRSIEAKRTPPTGVAKRRKS